MFLWRRVYENETLCVLVWLSVYRETAKETRFLEPSCLMCTDFGSFFTIFFIWCLYLSMCYDCCGACHRKWASYTERNKHTHTHTRNTLINETFIAEREQEGIVCFRLFRAKPFLMNSSTIFSPFRQFSWWSSMRAYWWACGVRCVDIYGRRMIREPVIRLEVIYRHCPVLSARTWKHTYACRAKCIQGISEHQVSLPQLLFVSCLNLESDPES